MSNAFLLQMTLRDLNQRYQESLIQYNGDIVLLTQFTEKPGLDGGRLYEITYTMLNDKNKLVSKHEPFDPDKLSLERFKAGWYISAGDPYYFNLVAKKQYNRGYRWNENCTVTGIREEIWSYEQYIRIFRSIMNSQTVRRYPRSAQELLDAARARSACVLSRNLAIVPAFGTNRTAVLFRQKYIGAIDFLTKKFTLTEPDFIQEVNECMVDLPNWQPAKVGMEAQLG